MWCSEAYFLFPPQLLETLSLSCVVFPVLFWSLVLRCSSCSSRFLLMWFTCVLLSILPLIVPTCVPLPECLNNPFGLAYVFFFYIYTSGSLPCHAMPCLAFIHNAKETLVCSFFFFFRVKEKPFHTASGINLPFNTVPDTLDFKPGDDSCMSAFLFLVHKGGALSLFRRYSAQQLWGQTTAAFMKVRMSQWAVKRAV